MLAMFQPIAAAAPESDGWQPVSLPGSHNAVVVARPLAANAAAFVTNGGGYDADQADYPGDKVDAFGADFYDRIHLAPSTIDFGNITDPQSRSVRLWNAFMNGQRLQTLTINNGEGVELDGVTAPSWVLPLRELTLTVDVDTDGPPDLDATIVFSFTIGDVVLALLGSRITAWTILPDWADGILERMEWLTDVITAYDASEQRRALRLAPRLVWEFSPFVEDARARRVLDSLLWGWGGRRWSLPIWPDGRRLNAQALIGATEIMIDTASTAFVAGGTAILIGDALTYESVGIDAVLADRVTLSRPLAKSWAAGGMIFPTRSSRIRDAVRLARWDRDLAGARIAFEVEEAIDLTPNAGATTHRGYPVLTTRPNWTDPPDYELARKLAELDGQVGLRVREDEGAIALPSVRGRWTFSTAAEREAWRALLYALRGRHGALWVPTWASDLVIVTPIANTATAFDVQHCSYTQFVGSQAGRRDVRIELVNGTVFYRRILSSEVISAEVERLQIDAALGVNVQVADVLLVSFMALSRLEGDAQELAHWTGSVAETATAFRGFRNDV